MSLPTTCPALALPPEITAEIFLRCVPDSRGPYLFDQPYMYTYDRTIELAVGYRPWNRGDIWLRPPPQLTLIKVCRLWRYIALGTPALWAELQLTDDCPAEAAVWLARAGDCPLTISICTAASLDDAPVLNIFQRHASKMRAVDLELSTDAFERMTETGPWSFPMLRTLSLWRYDADYTELPVVPIAVIAPLLREVSMCQWRPGKEVIGIPWYHLTDLTASHYSIDDCLSVLQGTPNLVQCRLSVFSRRRRRTGAHTTVVALPHLRALTIFKNVGNEGDEAGSADILDFLALPALHTLQIFDDKKNANVLNVLLARSAPPLHTLVLHQQNVWAGLQYVGTELAVSALAMLPTLTRLEIWRPTRQFATALLEDVFAQGRDRVLLPHLRTLAILGCRRLSEVGRSVAEQEGYEFWADEREWKPWAEGFGGDVAVGEVLLKFKSLAGDALEVVVENKRRVRDGPDRPDKSKY
ncbi:hypothetical protein B0H15DRAFT_546801 [Mycena belliarum]|uniref:F-box domain-containing protein n=1 Tax=Mycena belliarum TaxID=1033014 RepID=A0AAD6UCY7_9AGAR|nr:hypothetical protein B0H15DRAFT_546801 [Mycena belliae]